MSGAGLYDAQKRALYSAPSEGRREQRSNFFIKSTAEGCEVHRVEAFAMKAAKVGAGPAAEVVSKSIPIISCVREQIDQRAEHHDAAGLAPVSFPFVRHLLSFLRR